MVQAQTSHTQGQEAWEEFAFAAGSVFGKGAVAAWELCFQRRMC